MSPYINYKEGSDGNHRAEASADKVILSRSCAPIVHQNGHLAYVEFPTESNHWIKVNGEDAVWTSYMQLLYYYIVAKRETMFGRLRM